MDPASGVEAAEGEGRTGELPTQAEHYSQQPPSPGLHPAARPLHPPCLGGGSLPSLPSLGGLPDLPQELIGRELEC